MLYTTKIDFLIDFNGIQNLKIKQIFAWVGVHLLCAWFATLVWIHHALQFQILCIFTKAPGATLRFVESGYIVVRNLIDLDGYCGIIQTKQNYMFFTLTSEMLVSIKECSSDCLSNKLHWLPSPSGLDMQSIAIPVVQPKMRSYLILTVE